MREDEITDRNRYYLYNGTAHIVRDTHFETPPGSIWEHHIVNSYCGSSFDYGTGLKNGDVWSSREKVLARKDATLCSECQKAFEERKTGPESSYTKGAGLLREIIEERKKND